MKVSWFEEEELSFADELTFSLRLLVLVQIQRQLASHHGRGSHAYRSRNLASFLDSRWWCLAVYWRDRHLGRNRGKFGSNLSFVASSLTSLAVSSLSLQFFSKNQASVHTVRLT